MVQPVSTDHLVHIMKSARQRTLELLDGLTAAQLIGPKLPTVNPMQWEIGHVGWFHEYFILRRIYDYAALLERGDSLYDSIAIAHETKRLGCLCKTKSGKTTEKRGLTNATHRFTPRFLFLRLK